MRHKTMRVMLAACALAVLPGLAWAQGFYDDLFLDGRTRTQVVRAGPPSTARPHLGLLLWDYKTRSGESRCLVVHVYRGPAGEAGSVREGDLILAMNDVEVHSAAQFREQLEKVSPGSEVRLRLERASPQSLQTAETRDTAIRLGARIGFFEGYGIGGGAVETVTVRADSYAEWAQPIDWIRPPTRRVVPDELLKVGVGPTKLEQFLDRSLNEQGIKEPIDRLRQYLVQTVERFYGANMLDRVAYGYYRPTRLAELQVSITEPLARIVDERKDPWGVPRLILAEAAKNLDVSWSPRNGGEIDLANPRQALESIAQRVNRAHTHVEQAFGKLDAARRTELETSLPQLLELFGELGPSRPLYDRAITRARQASMAVHFPSLFAAADEVAGWRAAGAPPTEGSPPVSLPKELADAVKGDVFAVERIDGRWYVYGGPGRNEYDLSRIDVVIDAGGDDRYRYSRNERPKVQLVIDWEGDDVYSAENGVAGAASGMRGVSVLIDHQGNDRYEGNERSCGVGVMGIGLIVDHAGNDRYQGTKWSLGAGYYDFGGIVDLGAGSDEYTAEQYSQGIGGPRGFGLILDEKGRDVYRANPYPNNSRFRNFVQGVGVGNHWPIVGTHDTGGIGVLCDLEGDDRYEAGRFGQGHSFFFGLGILYDRAGNDLYHASRWSQASAVHGGVGILADDSGDDTYWAMDGGNQSGGGDHTLTLLIDRAGNDSYQGVNGHAQGTADGHGVGWLIDLEGHDRYITIRPSADVRPSQGESGVVEDYSVCRCFSWALLLDVGGTSDFYSLPDRADGMVKATGSLNSKNPERSTLHGLFIDTLEKISFWP